MIRHTPSAPRARPWSREILEDELGRVHAREFARLLCGAALLHLAARREPGPALLGRWLRTLELETDLAHWRHAARRARSLAEVDGYELAGLLRHALAHPPGEWAEPSRLVQAALEIDASEGTRWHAAALDWFEGRADARDRLAAFALRAASEAWRTRARLLLEQGEQAPW
jgi:hypothetical protein